VANLSYCPALNYVRLDLQGCAWTACTNAVRRVLTKCSCRGVRFAEVVFGKDHGLLQPVGVSLAPRVRRRVSGLDRTLPCANIVGHAAGSLRDEAHALHRLPVVPDQVSQQFAFSNDYAHAVVQVMGQHTQVGLGGWIGHLVVIQDDNLVLHVF
jgi:hypothetical protein